MISLQKVVGQNGQQAAIVLDFRTHLCCGLYKSPLPVRGVIVFHIEQT